jgi:hypothetical protein
MRTPTQSTTRPTARCTAEIPDQFLEKLFQPVRKVVAAAFIASPVERQGSYPGDG